MEVEPVHAWVMWLEQVRHLRTATVVAYESTLLKLSKFPHEGNLDERWSTVTAEHIEAFMGRVRTRNGVGSAATQDRDRVAILMFFKWAQARGIVTSNPVIDVGVPKVTNRMPRAVDDYTFTLLWRSEMADDDRLWLGLGCFAGLRRREIVSIAPTDVDWRRGMILGLERKGGSEDSIEYEQLAMILHEGLPNVLPDPHRWVDLMSQYAMVRHGERCLITYDAPTTAATRRNMSFADSQLPSPAVINKRLEVILVRAGLPLRAFSPHAMRHTCATNLLRCGVPIEVVSDVLGHSSIDTTRQYVKSSGRLREFRTERFGNMSNV